MSDPLLRDLRRAHDLRLMKSAPSLSGDAADRIEQLESENAELRDALVRVDNEISRWRRIAVSMGQVRDDIQTTLGWDDEVTSDE